MKNCSEHKNYAGKRAPRSDCQICWRIYFSEQTEVRKTKYPKEFEKYAPKKRSTEPKVAKIKQPTSVSRINSKQKVEDYKEKIRQKDSNKLYVDVPLLLGLRLWSQRLNTTIVINNYYPEKDLVEFSMVNTKLIPRSHLHNLLLFNHVPKWTENSTKIPPKVKKSEITIPIFNTNWAQIREKFEKAISSLYPDNRAPTNHKLFPWTLYDDLLLVENDQFILDEDLQPQQEDFKKDFNNTVNANLKKI